MPRHLATTELSIQVHSRLTPGPTSAYLYGALHGEPAIIHVARTSLDTRRAPQLVKEGLENLDVFLDNRPVSGFRWICAQHLKWG